MGYVEEVLEVFLKQSEHPPEGDPYIKACYKAVWEMGQGEGKVREFIERATSARHFSPGFFVNLFLRAFQLKKLFGDDRNGYPKGYDNEKKWKEELPKYLDLMLPIMLERETVTTIYPRYASPKAIISALGKDQVKVADFGCGGNYGLRGWVTGEPFEYKTDATPGRIMSEWLAQPTYVKKGIAIDKNDPEDPAVREWRLACSFYPGKLDKMDNLLAMEKRLEYAERVAFQQADLIMLELDNGGIKSNSQDAVIISTVLYQMNEKERQKVIGKACQALKKDGKSLVIIQEFAELDQNGDLRFFDNWFKEGYGYRTFVMGEMTGGRLLEVFQWDNARCKEVRAGKDLDEFRELLDLEAGLKQLVDVMT